MRCAYLNGLHLANEGILVRASLHQSKVQNDKKYSLLITT